MRKTFLTAALVLGFSAPAFASPPIKYVEPDTYASWILAEDETGKPATFVVVGDHVAWRFRGQWARKADEAAARLNASWRAGRLRSDHVTPGRRGKSYVVRCGEDTLLSVDGAFAAAQAARPAELTLQAIDALRQALGGVPLARQASRGGIPGVTGRSAMASWYGTFFHGRTAADGSRYDKHDFTVASKTLPFGTLLLVTNPNNNESALVKVTDRGPYIKGRSLDLSQKTAQVLGIEGAGVANVRYYILQ